MRILALDCATKTGWAICERGKIGESGVQEFALQRGESNGMRFLRFTRWLAGMADPACVPPPLRIDLIAFEAAHHRGGAATEICVGMTTRAQELAANIKAECLPVHTGRLKKWATGNGAASKDAMIREASKRWDDWGVENPILDDNHADAILLALYAWSEVGHDPAEV